MMDIQTIKTAAGNDIRIAAWRAPNGFHSLIYLNGLESHHGWFAGPAAKLAGQGISVYALDRRGSGLNASLAGNLRAWLSDIESALLFARQERPDAAVHLAALCLGAKLAIAFALRYPGRVRSLILVSPGLKTWADLPWFHKIKAGAGLFHRRKPTLPSPVTDINLFTKDPAALGFIRSDPMRRTMIPAAEFLEIRRLDRMISHDRKTLGPPVLTLYAEEDFIVDQESTTRMLKSYASGRDGAKVDFKVYPRTSHALTLEPTIPLAEDIAAWIGKFPARKGRRNKVLILKTSYTAVEKAVDEALDTFPRDWKNKKVLVKPNVLAAFAPDCHCTTHPSLVKAVVAGLARRGAEVTVGDNSDRLQYGENEQSFRVSGIYDAVRPYYRNIGLECVSIPLGGRSGLKAIRVSKAVLEADLIVSLPKFKTHQLTQISGAIKNCFGYVAGGEKARAHRFGPTESAFARVLMDVFELRPPDLVIMDAMTGMEGDGPTSKRLRPDIGRILVSENAVDLDTVMAEMMGFDRSRIELLQEAYRRGRGARDLADIDILGPFARLPGFKKPSTSSSRIRRGGRIFVANRFLFGWLYGSGVRLSVNTRICRSCGSCRDACPPQPKAVEMDPQGTKPYPRFRRDRCIQCYCCMEACPEQAISKRTPMGKWLFKKHFG
jgi:uncharacterized protein (DUF362 family)/alpha-beta hydrolase superfamily lysophospholipase/Pyruvate/2-oxoacid:ferredoxin oxidoreductase delta subunit